jgi:trans-2,3-dihydro-3-hydroxyanthranilate isomerase
VRSHLQDRESEGPIDYHHVDVFSDRPYSGNSLAVFVDPPPMSGPQMLAITQELHHFETIFVSRPVGAGAGTVSARVFDLVGELDFAGHPVLGAAAVLHDLEATGERGAGVEERTCSVGLNNDRVVEVTTRRDPSGALAAVMDQGQPAWVTPPAVPEPEAVAAALGLDASDLDATLPLEVVSTGLRYLVVPVVPDAMGRARISRGDFSAFLGAHDAEFAYLLSASAPGPTLEGRHWANDGIVEDVATGSAAGCVAAYLRRHERTGDGELVQLHQGRFVGRPSRLAIQAFGSPDAITRVVVGGDVAVVGTGRLDRVPPGGAR